MNPQRLSLALPTEPRNADSLDKDALVRNAFLEKDPANTKYVVKRPGLTITNTLATGGVFYNPNNDTSYYVDDTNNIQEIDFSPPAIPFWSPYTSYSGGDTVIFDDNRDEWIAIQDSKGQPPYEGSPYWELSLWKLLGTNIIPFSNFGLLGTWFLNGFFYVYAYSNALQTTYNIYRTSGDISNPATYSFVSSGTVPLSDQTNTIPVTTAEDIAISYNGSTGYFLDSGIFGLGNVWTSSDGSTWTSPLFDTGERTSGYPSTAFGSFLYRWDKVDNVLHKFTTTTITAPVTTSGLSVEVNANVVLGVIGSTLYLIECGITTARVRLWSSADAVNWTLRDTQATSHFVLPISSYVQSGKIYILSWVGSNGTNKIKDITTTGTSLTIVDANIDVAGGQPDVVFTGYTDALYSTYPGDPNLGHLEKIYKRTSL